MAEPKERSEDSQAVFRAAEDWWHNAVVGYLGDGWFAYVDGYRTAADRLVQTVAEDRTMLDTIIYPIVFLYRQYLELSLKALIRDLEDLLEHDRSPPDGHRLPPLFDRFRSNVVEFCRGQEEELPDIDRIALVVEAFHEADPGSLTFRYPVGKDGHPSHEYGHINVRVLQERMAEVAKTLDAVQSALSYYLDLRSDMWSNWGP